MPPKRLLQIIQSHAAKLVALWMAEAMKVLTESGVDHEGKQVFPFCSFSFFPLPSQKM